MRTPTEDKGNSQSCFGKEGAFFCERKKVLSFGKESTYHRFEALRDISKTFHKAYTIILSGKRIGSHIGSASSNIQHILWLISSFKQRDVGEILVGLQGR